MFQGALVNLLPPAFDFNQSKNATLLSPYEPSLRAAVMALSSLGLSGAIYLGKGVTVASFSTGWPRALRQV